MQINMKNQCNRKGVKSHGRQASGPYRHAATAPFGRRQRRSEPLSRRPPRRGISRRTGKRRRWPRPAAGAGRAGGVAGSHGCQNADPGFPRLLGEAINQSKNNLNPPPPPQKAGDWPHPIKGARRGSRFISKGVNAWGFICFGGGVNGSASPPGCQDGDFHPGADGKELRPRRDGGPGERNRLFV